MRVLLLTLLGLPLIGATTLPWVKDGAAQVLAVLISLGQLVISVALAADVGTSSRPHAVTDARWIPTLGVHFHVALDGVSSPLVVLTTLLTFLCCLYTLRVAPAPGRPGRLLALVLLLQAGALGTFAAADLVLFFVAFEVVLVPMYFLISGWGGGERAGHAATKYVLYTLLGSALMLIGLLLLGIRAGTSDMTVLTQRHGAGLDLASQVLAFIAIALGLAIKSPLWPLHTWLPDAHTEAPTVGSVLLAGVLLKMGTYGLIRIAVPDLPSAAHDFAPVLAILATVAVVYGALCCLAQRDLKRLIAYSSVGHMGFVLLGISTLTSAGIDAALFGNIAHGLVTGLLFFLVGGLKDRHHTGNLTAIGGGLFLRLPRYGALLTFAAVASLGLPGLAGFWGEVLALLAAYHPAAGLSLPLFRALMAAGFLGTLLTAGYFLLLLDRLTFGPVRRGAEVHEDVQVVEWLAWSPLVVGILALGLYPRMLLAVTHPVTVLLVAR